MEGTVAAQDEFFRSEYRSFAYLVSLAVAVPRISKDQAGGRVECGDEKLTLHVAHPSSILCFPQAALIRIAPEQPPAPQQKHLHGPHTH